MPNKQNIDLASNARSSPEQFGKLPFLVIVAILCVASIVKFSLFGDYVASSLLFQDDTIFLGHYYFGMVIESPPTQAFYFGLVEIITSIGGIFGAKILLLIVQTGISLFAYLIINQFARAKVMALALSLALMHYPVALDQNFFVIGAHPQFGVLALFAGVYCLFSGQFSQPEIFTRKSLIFTFLAGVCFVVGARSSPTLMLMPVLFLAALVVLVLEHGFRSQFDSRHVWAGTGLSLVSGVLLYSGSNYHYSSIEGWVDVSAAQILNNFVAALSSIVQTPFEDRVWFLFIVAVGVVLSLVLAFLGLRASINGTSRDPERDRKLLFLGFLVICAACLFGPGSVATSYLNRYVIAPYSVMALVLGCLLGWSYKNATTQIGQVPRVSVLVVMSALSVSAIWVAGTATRDALLPYTKAHSATVSALQSFSFEEDDQIVVLLPDSAFSPTSGFNHWSTWYLRMLTRNPTIIGLVGTQSMYDPALSSVFVEEYKDHDPSYWATRGGRSYRVQLVGLETDRRLFAFSPDGDGVLKPRATVAADQHGVVRRVQFGERFSQAVPEQSAFDQICESEPSETERVARFVSDQSQGVGRTILEQLENARVARRVELIDEVFESNGEVAKQVNANLNSGDLVQIELSMLPASRDTGAGAYTDTFPPMPLLSSTIAIYQIGNNFRITTREEPSQSFNIQLIDDDAIELTIVGCVGGQAAIMVGADVVGSTSDFSPTGEWVLGKGFLRRYWQGQFLSFRVTYYQGTGND